MRIAIVLLSLALVAAVAAGLAGLWPNLRDRSNVSDRRERVRIAEGAGFEDHRVVSGVSAQKKTRRKIGKSKPVRVEGRVAR